MLTQVVRWRLIIEHLNAGFFFLAPLDRDLWLLPTPDPTPVLEYLIVIPGVGMDIF